MRVQFNVVTADVRTDAMVNAESYRDLLVRIPGYDACFGTLNRTRR